MPQLPQKRSSVETGVSQLKQDDITSSYRLNDTCVPALKLAARTLRARPARRPLVEHVKFQKRLADDYLVAVAKVLPVAGQESAAAVDEGAVGRAEVFDVVLPRAPRY